MLYFNIYFSQNIFSLDPKQLAQARSLIDSAQNILITTHRSPDGDAIGSSLALMLFLKRLGKSSTVIVPNDYPQFLNWMAGQDEILVFEEKEAACAEIIRVSDLIFSLDYNVLHRTGDMAAELAKSSAPFILIDHHQQPGDYPEVTFSDTASCSTCQMIFEFIDGLGHKDLIDSEIAECIYCGIMTDSGSFRFPSVTPETHRIVASLIEEGLDHAKVHRNVYDTNLLDRLKLLGYALSNKLQVMDGHHAAIITLSKNELEKHNYRPGDTEGLVNYALSMQGINLAVFVREGNNQVKMSFRSKGSFDVNQFARTHFHGGGHKNAAGASSSRSLEDTVAKLKTDIQQYTDQLNY
ncbi:MAG: bifunctional oligoribonuclease/PAP phosphatase NrnA [Flavobacteriales bacterium]|nr:bifunctional oligoribonuclease/PAP phosphatase NrnA [Flavobacteriales bacterium]